MLFFALWLRCVAGLVDQFFQIKRLFEPNAEFFSTLGHELPTGGPSDLMQPKTEGLPPGLNGLNFIQGQDPIAQTVVGKTRKEPIQIAFIGQSARWLPI